MNRYCLVLLVLCFLHSGCRRASTTTPAPNTPANPAADYAKRKFPVLNRTIVMNDFKNLYLLMDGGRASSGKWPPLEAIRPGLQREAPGILKHIEDGYYVVIWNAADGILAHTAIDGDGDVMTLDTGGQVTTMKPQELRQALANQRR